MAYTYLDELTTPGVVAAQNENGARGQWADFAGKREFTVFDEAAAGFIAARDSFYLASNSASGWPYLQHRGGPPGFLKLLGPDRLGFADYRGNRQYITTGNVATDDKVSLFLMDYRRRKRMKILARTTQHAADDRELAPLLVDSHHPAEVERLFTFDLVAYDWNCPQHITQRFTRDEVEATLAAMQEEMDRLRAECAALRDQK